MSLCKELIINLLVLLISIGIIPICILEYQYRDPNLTFLPKFSISLILIGFLIWYFSSNENEDLYEAYQYGDNVYYDYSKHKKEELKSPKYYCYQTDVETFERMTPIYTNEQVGKLLQTEEFKKMSKEKGEDLNNWNWQSRERINSYPYQKNMNFQNKIFKPTFH